MAEVAFRVQEDQLLWRYSNYSTRIMVFSVTRSRFRCLVFIGKDVVNLKIWMAIVGAPGK